MATQLSTLISDARKPLQELSASFWTDAELLVHAIAACRDLWRAVIDLHDNHFVTDDITNVSLAASTGTLTGVPADTFRVVLIEPRDTTPLGSSRNLIFKPAKSIAGADYRRALTLSAQDPGSGGILWYVVTNAGSPVATPTIKVAPQVTSAVLLRFVYIPTLGALTSSSNNPIPGESDQAVTAFIVANALAKDREDRSPDPNWLAIYATEKKAILGASAPRQEQEPQVVRGIFDDEDDYLW